MGKEKDFSCLDLIVYLNNCESHYELSDKYESIYPQKERWWDDKNEKIKGGQKVHVIAYLGHCYYLKGKSKNSVKHIWSSNGFNNAAGIIWLLEALGADDTILKAAYNNGIEAGKAGKNQCEQARFIKKAIAWEYIASLLNAKGIKEKKMRLLINKNKINFFKYKLSRLVIVAIIITLASVFMISCGSDEKKEIVVPENLPSLSELDPNETPMLYDYVNSSLGCYFDANNSYFTDYGTYFAILINIYDDENYYSEYYAYGERPYLPIIGTSPLKQTISDKEKFNEYVEKIDKNRKFYEGDYLLIIVTEYYFGDNKEYNGCQHKDGNNLWGGEILDACKKNELGLMYKYVYEDGNGWPIEFVRREPFLSLCEEKFFVHFDSDFWDNYDYLQVLNFDNEKGDTLTACAYKDWFFDTEYTIDGKEYSGELNEDQLNDVLRVFNFAH